MGPEDIIADALILANTACNLIATEELLAYPKQLADIETQLNVEIAKGYGNADPADNADDNKIVALKQQRGVIIHAIANEVAVWNASKGQATTSNPAPSASSPSK